MSQIDKMKDLKRQQKVSPTEALVAPMKEHRNVRTQEQINVDSKEAAKIARNEEKIERTRRSFDVRTDLYRKLKVLSSEEDAHIYLLIEEALEAYLENK